MAALPLLRNTNMATVTWRKNIYYIHIKIYDYIQGEPCKGKLTRWLLSFSCDYLKITSNNINRNYRRVQSGTTVLVTGSRVSFRFHSDYSVQMKGFRLYLSIVSLGKSLLNFPPVSNKRFWNDSGLSSHCICTYKKYHGTKWDLAARS